MAMRSKALFTFWDGADGHFFRASAIARTLSKAGFDVGFMSPGSHIAKIRQLPFRTEVFHVENRKASIHNPPYALPIFSHAFRHAQRLRGLEFDDVGFLMRTVEEELKIVKSFKPSVIINDYRDTIRITAEIVDLPIIGTTITTGNSAGHSMGWWLEPPSDLILPNCLEYFNEVRVNYDLPLITDERQSFEGNYTIIPSSETIDPLKVKRDTDVYVGIIDKPRGHKEKTEVVEIIARLGKKIVFCNLGDDNYKAEWRFDSILCQLVDLVDAVFVVAGRINDYPRTYQAASEKRHVLISPEWSNADYEWIIKNSSAIISHGGNTATLALSYGIPVIFIPRNTEPGSAYTVDQYGAGINLKHSERPLERRFAPDLGANVEIMGHWESEIDAALLKKSLEQILGNPRYTLKARVLAAELNKYGGADEVLRVIGKL